MVKSSSIIALIVVATIGVLTLPSTMLKGFSQSLEIPEFKSKAQAIVGSNGESTVSTSPEEIAMKVQLEEHNNEILANSGYYEVSDFALIASNSSKLCNVGTCDYELEDGQMHNGVSAGDRILTGKFKVDTGESKKVMNLRSSWETVEERQTPDGETIEVIEGKFGIGKNQFSPEHEYRIEGTLTPDGDEYILEANGFK